jgi:hypothetical protein
MRNETSTGSHGNAHELRALVPEAMQDQPGTNKEYAAHLAG